MHCTASSIRSRSQSRTRRTAPKGIFWYSFCSCCICPTSSQCCWRWGSLGESSQPFQQEMEQPMVFRRPRVSGATFRASATAITRVLHGFFLHLGEAHYRNSSQALHHLGAQAFPAEQGHMLQEMVE